MTSFSSDDRQAPVREAAAWLARLHAEDRSATDEAAFRSWIAADPANARALDRASAVWERVGGLSGRIDRNPTRTLAVTTRRAVLAGLGTVAITGAGLIGWQRAYAGVYETQIGEQRRVTLTDGSHLILDTATRLRVRMHPDRRELQIQAGRVCLEIAVDPRPFEISTKERDVLAQKGRLDVRCDEGGTSIVVSEGSADIIGGGARRKLDVGERLRIERDHDEAVDRPNLDDLLAWQSGRTVFRDETLDSAAREMNRYTDRKLVISDPQVARLRLSGVYRVGDTAAFARSVAMLLPVHVTQTPDEIRLTALKNAPEGVG